MIVKAFGSINEDSVIEKVYIFILPHFEVFHPLSSKIRRQISHLYFLLSPTVGDMVQTDCFHLPAMSFTSVITLRNYTHVI